MDETKPFVNVTLEGPDDGGDFGRNTPGTGTGGIQEAIDYAHANFRDVYIWGGRGGVHDGVGTSANVYHLDESLRVPWSQDFQLDGGNYVLAYKPKHGHAVHIDSQMNCRYKFGLITSAAPEAVVAIRPETPGPDDFTVVTASVFDFGCAVSNHPEGTGILLDSSRGPIVNSKLFAEETNTQGTGMHLSDCDGKGHIISNNSVEILYGNQCHATGNCTGLQLGDPGTENILHNRLALSFHAPRGAHFDEKTKRYVTVEGLVAENAIGADICAQRNQLTLSFYGQRHPGQDIIFEEGARDNTITALSLPNGVTNKARIPSNRIITNWPAGFSVDTPPVPPSGKPVVNTSSHTVQVFIVEAGQVSSWTVADCGSTAQLIPYNLSLVDNLTDTPKPPGAQRESQSQTIASGLYAGQTVLLEPGDEISFDYSEPPVWRWKGSI